MKTEAMYELLNSIDCVTMIDKKIKYKKKQQEEEIKVILKSECGGDSRNNLLQQIQCIMIIMRN